MTVRICELDNVPDHQEAHNTNHIQLFRKVNSGCQELQDFSVRGIALVASLAQRGVGSVNSGQAP